MKIDISAFERRLEAAVRARGLAAPKLRISPYEGGGVHTEVDGDACMTNIGLWPNGLFDVEYVSLPTEETTLIHRDFESEDEALDCFVEEYHRAVERAWSATNG
jgi:hypothetical protein